MLSIINILNTNKLEPFINNQRKLKSKDSIETDLNFIKIKR
jgi:hypothetical protein